jgi:FkbM family methyltransferase
MALLQGRTSEDGRPAHRGGPSAGEISGNLMENPVLPCGALRPGWLDKAVIALTSSLPNTWAGLRLAILLRRLVTMRLASRALDVERWGLRMRLHPLDNGCEKNLLFTPQMYEPEECAALLSEIRRTRDSGKEFVFVDIGANVGLFSLFVAAQAGARARILAVEPEPGNLARLTFNLAANAALPITPFAVALGEDEGERAVVLNRSDRGGTQVRPLAERSAGETARVRCIPLLKLLRDNGIASIDALKIDVEGMEDAVLAPFFRDAPKALWPTLIIIEDSSPLWKADVFGLLAECGYTVVTRSKQNVILRRRDQSF